MSHQSPQSPSTCLLLCRLSQPHLVGIKPPGTHTHKCLYLKNHNSTPPPHTAPLACAQAAKPRLATCRACRRLAQQYTATLTVHDPLRSHQMNASSEPHETLTDSAPPLCAAPPAAGSHSLSLHSTHQTLLHTPRDQAAAAEDCLSHKCKEALRAPAMSAACSHPHIGWQPTPHDMSMCLLPCLTHCHSPDGGAAA